MTARAASILAARRERLREAIHDRDERGVRDAIEQIRLFYAEYPAMQQAH